jgi:hypothetical protein
MWVAGCKENCRLTVLGVPEECVWVSRCLHSFYRDANVSRCAILETDGA